jgi:cellulose synthase (UDP-forming)
MMLAALAAPGGSSSARETDAMTLPLLWGAASMLAPGLIAAGAAVAVMAGLDAAGFGRTGVGRHSGMGRQIVIAVAMVLAARYLAWRLFWTLPPFSWSFESLFAIVFLAIETTAMLGGMLSMALLMKTRDRRKQADANQGWQDCEPAAPLVDILICTYNEEAAILERTIVGALAQTYTNFRVWLLDDGRRPEIAALCGALGCNYLTRDDNRHAKAGNINAAIRTLATLNVRPDFVAILDADFVPFPRFVERAMALHKAPDVGIVQTPQHFINPDPIQTNLDLAKLWPDEQRFFFDVIMASKDAWDQAFCCGTSSIIRFEPLVRIGGFPTDSVTEDFLLSLRLKEVGYSTVYLNEPLSLGLAPEGLREYLTQRGRWCLGFMQITRGRSGPLSRSANLRLLDRVVLVENFLAWSSGYVLRLAGLLAPPLFLFCGVKVVSADIGDTLGYFLPFFFWHSAAMCWISAGRLMPILGDIAQLIAAPTIVKAAFVGLFGSRDQKFMVTAKGGDRSRRFVEWGLFKLYAGALIVTLAGVAYYFRQSNLRIDAYGGLALAWCWYNIVILTLTCFACVERPRYRKSERYATSEWVWVVRGGKRRAHQLEDISIDGARLRGASVSRLGDMIGMEIAETLIPAKLVRIGPDFVAVEFVHTVATRVAMTRHFYAAGYYKTFEATDPLAIGKALAARVFA